MHVVELTVFKNAQKIGHVNDPFSFGIEKRTRKSYETMVVRVLTIDKG
jgi:hypothetical protein